MRTLVLTAFIGAALITAGCSSSGSAGGTDDGPETGGTPDQSDELFDPTKIVEIAIEMSPGDWDFVRTQQRDASKVFMEGCLDEPFFSPFEYRSGSVTVNGEKRENVGIRKKGFLGSLDDNKPSLKIKFDEFEEGQELSGFERMTLNNNRSDPEHVAQCMAYRLFTRAGVPAPRCNFAHVTVNGANLGLFTHLESIKKRFLRRHFVDDEGRLFEGTLSDFDDVWEGTFEIKTNRENPDRSAIEAVTEALEMPDEQLEEALSALVDLDEFMNFWAVETLISHVDGYASGRNNFYVYFDPATGLMNFIPWGVDATFRHSIKYGTSPVYTHAKMARRLYELPATRDRYVAALRRVLDDLWNEAELIDEIDRMEALIAPVAAEDYFVDAGKDYPPGKADSGKDPEGKEPSVTGEVGIRAFIQGRRAQMEPVLEAPPMLIENPPGIPCDSKGGGPEECQDGETFEKNGVTYTCIDGIWTGGGGKDG